jgi:hypothetical protein
MGEHVGLLDAGEPVDRRTIELHALGERRLELRGGDGERLEVAEHVGEPQPDEPDAAFFDGAQDVLVLFGHGDLRAGILRLGRRGEKWRCRPETQCSHFRNRGETRVV